MMHGHHLTLFSDHLYLFRLMMMMLELELTMLIDEDFTTEAIVLPNQYDYDL